MGFWFGRSYGISLGIIHTVSALIEGGFVKTRKLPDGQLDLIKLSFEEKLDDTTKTTNS